MFFEKITNTLLNNTSNVHALRWEGVGTASISTSKPSGFLPQHWDFQSKLQRADNCFVLDLGYAAQTQSQKDNCPRLRMSSLAAHASFYTITSIKDLCFFSVSFTTKRDAAALFHFLLPLNKKILFQSHLFFADETGYFPVSSPVDSFVSAHRNSSFVLAKCCSGIHSSPAYSSSRLAGSWKEWGR